MVKNNRIIILTNLKMRVLTDSSRIFIGTSTLLYIYSFFKELNCIPRGIKFLDRLKISSLIKWLITSLRQALGDLKHYPRVRENNSHENCKTFY